MVRDRLSDYLPAAVSKPLPFAYEAVPADSAPVELRDAKPEEIRGIKGEWARRTLRVVRTKPGGPPALRGEGPRPPSRGV